MVDLKSAISIINTALNTKESIEISAFIYDLQDRITKLSDERSALKETIVGLKTQIADHATWEKEKEKYQIIDWMDAKVYSLKGTDEIFCPVCFNKNKMPIHIQPRVVGLRTSLEMLCPNCKTAYPCGLVKQ